MKPQKTILKHIGRQIAVARLKRNLSQKELGELVGMLQTNISKYEAGTFENPGISTIEQIAASLGYSVEVKLRLIRKKQQKGSATEPKPEPKPEEMDTKFFFKQ